MPELYSVWGFFDTVKKISPKEIEDEASIGFKLALIGAAADRARLRDALLTPSASVLERDEAENHLREFDAAPDQDASKAFSFMLYAGPEGEPIGVRNGRNSAPFVGTLEQIVNGMLARRTDLAVALGRRLPAFRAPACALLIRETSRVNAGIAVISALPGLIPPIGPITIPATSVADVLLLTKNQIVLVMRLAAAYGHKPTYKKQIREIIATTGSALGWRTLAREVVGLVPAGIGAGLKAVIAYSGTVAVGRAAQIFYQTGRKATAAEIRAAYEESQDEARQAVQALGR
jgi:uncharacterized protein (DUF697 family)